MTGSDFYEDDEPVKDIEAAFNRSVKGYTSQAALDTTTISLGRTYSRTWLVSNGWAYGISKDGT